MKLLNQLINLQVVVVILGQETQEAENHPFQETNEAQMESLAVIFQNQVVAEDPAADLAIVVLENLVAIKLEDLVTIVLQNLGAIKKQDLRQKHVGKKLNRSDSSLEI
jgi:hypothetical protein